MHSHYTLKLSGVAVRLDIDDTGHAIEDSLGEAQYRFSPDLARLLAPMSVVLYNGFGEGSSRTLDDMSEDATGSTYSDACSESDDPDSVELVLSVDGGIAAVALLVSRGEPFTYTVDLDTANGGEFWAFHDVSHALDDVSADWDSGEADFPSVGAWAEDRANVEGARLALRHGMSLDDVLGSLTLAAKALADRFEGEESTAIDDLLSGGLEFLSDEVRPDLARIPAHVDDVARDILGRWENASEDDLDDDAIETCQGDTTPTRAPGLTLASLPEWRDAYEDIASPGESVALDVRASYAFECAVRERVRELHRESVEDSDDDASDYTLDDEESDAISSARARFHADHSTL